MAHHPIVFPIRNTMGAIVFRSVPKGLLRLSRGEFGGPGGCNFKAKYNILNTPSAHPAHPGRLIFTRANGDICPLHSHHEHAVHPCSLSTHDETCLRRSPRGHGLSPVPQRESIVLRLRLSFSSPREGETKSLSRRERDELEPKQLRGGKNRTEVGP